jgi:hypothetical protein
MLMKSNTGSVTKRDFAKVRKIIRRAVEAAKRSAKSKRRFALYKYLKSVYRGYCELEDQRLLRASKILLDREFNVPADYEWHSIRRIIEATALEEDLRARSRWTRALEFAWNEETEPEHLIWFLGQNGGLSGCARFAAKGLPRYNYADEDEDEDDESNSGDDDDDCEINPPRWEKEEEERLRKQDSEY